MFKRNTPTITILAMYLVAIFVAGIFALSGIDSTVIPTSDYVIRNFEVVASVQEDNIVAIEENIIAYFEEGTYKHGIYRTLPLSARVGETDENGKIKYKGYHYTYENIWCNQPYVYESENGVLLIRAGSAYEYVDGQEVTYTFKYEINLGHDRNFSKDMFYYNLIGTGWDAKILNSSITINFPKEVTSTPVIYYGSYGETNTSSSFNFDKRTLTYTHNQTLNAGEGLTVKVDLEEGYFNAPRKIGAELLGLGLVVAVMLFVIFAYYKLSNKEKLTPIVQFSPSKDITSADIGYLIDRCVDDKDLASLIIYWAQKGYLKIVETQGVTRLIKLKEADAFMKDYEKILFNNIFKNSNEKNLNKTDASLYTACQTATKSIEVHNKSSFNEKSVRFREVACILVSVILSVVMYRVAYTSVNYAGITLALGCGASVYLLLKSLCARVDAVKSGKKLCVCFALISLGLIIWYMISYYSFAYDICCSVPVAIVLCVLSAFFMNKYNIRTTDGMNKLNDIIGLRTFIEVAEKDRLEALLKDNPSMFYDVLPYAYVLELYDEWCKKFENLIITTPPWVESDVNAYNSMYINYYLSRSLVNFVSNVRTSRAIAISKSSSSSGRGRGGGFSGGGFSGGGHGGGGGGSW